MVWPFLLKQRQVLIPAEAYLPREVRSVIVHVRVMATLKSWLACH